MVFAARDLRRMSAIVTTSGSAARPDLYGRVLLTRYTHLNAGLIKRVIAVIADVMADVTAETGGPGRQCNGFDAATTGPSATRQGWIRRPDHRAQNWAPGFRLHHP